MESTDRDELEGLGLPAYAHTEEDAFFVRVAATQGLTLPVLSVGPHDPDACAESSIDSLNEVTKVELDIVQSFFRFIEGQNNELVVDFIRRGLVSPDSTNGLGETPLLAAVGIGSVALVNTLISLGAVVDGFGQAPRRGRGETGSDICSKPTAPRTALQLAAERGNLAIVRVLREKHGADDGIVAPDGALALRLAAANGHREIVDYLPARRGGAWFRWKTAHAAEVKKMKRAIFGILRFIRVLVWIPKYLLYNRPKKLLTGAWKRRREIANMVKTGIVQLPEALHRAGKATWRGLKKLPGLSKQAGKKTLRAVKRIPGWSCLVARTIWRFLKRLPGAMMIVLRWIGNGFKVVGDAVARATKQVVSFLHTTFVAIISWCRSVTLKDAWHGFCHAIGAILFGIPLTIWDFAKTFTTMSYHCLEALLGTLGKVLWYTVGCLLWIAYYVPKRTWRLFASMGRSVCNGVHEGHVFFNPKIVSR